MSEGKVRFSRDGAIGRIVFDNPSALNALTFEMWRELGRLCKELADDKTLRVVTLRGEGGKAFLAGTDISGFLDFTSGDDGVAYEREMDSYVSAVESLPMTTIAIVEGYAVGGGLALSFACDLRIATPDARFGSPLGRSIGNLLSARGYARLVAHVGIAQAKRILLLGEMVGAEQLHALGQIHAIAPRETLDEVAAAMCKRAEENAPLTSRVSKEAIRRLTYAGLPDTDDLIRLVYGSDDFKMGVRHFLEKKDRVWTGS
ncbi:MAG TPA: enoyl-CoA hydratase [Terricaulis sp.]|nr:enoyl-CoA hydratase [Terricaulis sp.]